MDLLRAGAPAGGGFGGGGGSGILGALQFPTLDPQLLQQIIAQRMRGATQPFAAPATAAATPAIAQPASAPGGLQQRFPERAPQQQSMPTPAAAATPPPQAPQPHVNMPAIEPMPQMNEAAALTNNIASLPENISLPPLAPPSILERMNTPMGSSTITPMDGISLGMSMMGAAEPSWNVNQPSGWTRAGQALAETMDRGQERADRSEQRDAFRASNAREAQSFEHQQREWHLTDQQRAAAAAAIAAMPAGPEKDWALANPDEFARLQLQETAGVGHQVVSDGFVWTQGPHGTLTRGDEVPLTAAQRAEHSARLAAIAHQNDPQPLTSSGRLQIIQGVATANQLDHALSNVERLMHGVSMGDLRVGGPRYAALQSAYTNLALLLKGPQMYNLGQLSNSDLRMLQQVVGDPTNFEQFIRDAGGVQGLQARLGQLRENVDYSRQQIQQNYGAYAHELPPGLLNFDAHANDPHTDAPTPQIIAALRQHANDPAAVSAFRAQYGDELTNALLGAGGGGAPAAAPQRAAPGAVQGQVTGGAGAIQSLGLRRAPQNILEGQLVNAYQHALASGNQQEIAQWRERMRREGLL